MLHYTFAVALCLSATTGLCAQSMGNYGAQKQQMNEASGNYIQQNVVPQFRAVPRAASVQRDGNAVEIGINALSNQKASSYTAIFSVMQVGKTAEETNALLNQRLNTFLENLAAMGIPKVDIYVDMVNFLPKYEYDVSKKVFSKKTYTEVPKGFELQKNVHIRYKDHALLDRIVTAAAAQEIFDIVKVDYFVPNAQSIYSQLREASFKYLADIKKQYQSIGVRLDSAYVVTGENAWVAYPINRYESYQAFSAQALEQNEKQSATVNSADKPIARFYNAVPADDYDIVINPEILEPAVQFSYSLIVRFTLPDRRPAVRTETKKEFILVTPNGEVKTLKID